MRTFAQFVAIDWSGAKGERLKGIAVARCTPGRAAPVLVEADRRWSRGDVLAWLRDELPADSLVGLDLSPALPFGDTGYFPGWAASPADARTLWRLIDDLCADDRHFAAASVVAHPEARRYFRHGRGDCGDRFEAGAGRLRLTERRQKDAGLGLSPSSCFNLVGAAQVGKSSLTGMRVLHRLRGRLPVWPFDPVPPAGSLIVEIYTTIAARAARVPKGRSKLLDGVALDAALHELGVDGHAPLSAYTDHATDAILTAAWLRRAADDPALWHPAGLTPAIAATEGWTFGVP